MRLITPTSEVRISPIQSGTQVVSRVVKALPIDKLRAGDLQVVQAQASGSNGPRMVQQFFRTPIDWALTLPAAILKPAVTSVATAPLLRLKAHFAEQADYDRLATMVYQQGPNTQVVVSMTAAFAALNGGYDLVVPDLAAAPGFDPAWGLHAGTSVLWNAVRIGGTLGLGVDAVPADGLVQRLGQTIGSIP
jgi:hypothetical protein